MFVGGIRQRLIKDNLVSVLTEQLTNLGWFNSDRKHMPVRIVSSQLDSNVEIKPNSIGISFEDIISDELEMGSDLTETRISAFIDVFAEDDSVGMHLSGDLYDILRGKFTSFDADSFIVKDLTSAGQDELFYCQIENVDIARVRNWEKSYNKFWWVIAIELVDRYTNESVG